MRQLNRRKIRLSFLGMGHWHRHENPKAVRENEVCLASWNKAKGRKEIHRKMKRVSIWQTNVLGLAETMGRWEGFWKIFQRSSLSTSPSSYYTIVISGDRSLLGAGPLSSFRPLGGRSEFLPESLGPCLFSPPNNLHGKVAHLGAAGPWPTYSTLNLRVIFPVPLHHAGEFSVLIFRAFLKMPSTVGHFRYSHT